MAIRGWGIAALAAYVLTGCVPTAEAPNAWSPAEHAVALGVAADDPWCVHMRDLRRHLDGNAPPPGDSSRNDALAQVRAEAVAAKDGDSLWPFRKALICELIDGAVEERAEFDWNTAALFLADARAAATNPPAADGISPLVPVYDHLNGGEPASLAPVDLTSPAYCEAAEQTELALSQQRGGVVESVGFPGSLQRAPDWFAQVQVTYARWAREQEEGHQTQPGAVDFGGIPFHCKRFHAAYEGSRQFAVKDNLIFLLPELDDPNKAGRLVVQDAEGNAVVLDRILAAAQLNADGTGGETVDFFAEDLKASASLSGAVDRSNSLPPPKVFEVLFEYNARDLVADAPGVADLQKELATRKADEPLRIAMTGHADCVGPNWYNQILSEDRVRAVFDGVIKPALTKQGFDEDVLSDPKRFKLAGLGEKVPAVERAGRCEATAPDRRVVVVVQ